MQSNQQIPQTNGSYTLSGKPALFADRRFTCIYSVRSGYGGLCEARTAFFEIPQPGFPPLGEREGGFLIPNRYSYVVNNPLRYNDPSGYRIQTAPGEDETYINHDALRYIGGGRMGPGSGKHWSDSFNMSMGNFHIFSESTLGLPIGTDTRTVDFGMLNGLSGFFYNFVSISSQRRVGKTGSEDFRVTFDVGYVRRFIYHRAGGRFPLDERVNSYLEFPGRFGGSRDGGSRKHGGADLYAPVGTNVYAVKGGTVIQNPYKFYRGSYAIEIDHGNFIARYCEINVTIGLLKGSIITQGQLIGTIADLSLNRSMLHFEMYSGNGIGPLTNRTNPPYMRGSDLIDPTRFLNLGY